jgi:hypothetical protein
MKKISLFYREGASDKVYHASLEPTGNGLWVVNQSPAPGARANHC